MQNKGDPAPERGAESLSQEGGDRGVNSMVETHRLSFSTGGFEPYEKKCIPSTSPCLTDLPP